MGHQLCVACKYYFPPETCQGDCSYSRMFKPEDLYATYEFYKVYLPDARLVDVNSENSQRIRQSTTTFEVNARNRDQIYGITGLILLLDNYLYFNKDYESALRNGVWYGWSSPLEAVLIQPDTIAQQVATDSAAEVQHQSWAAVPTNSAEQIQRQTCTACFFLSRSCSPNCEFARFFSPSVGNFDFRCLCFTLFTRRDPILIPNLQQLSGAETSQIKEITALLERRARDYDPIYGASRILLTLVSHLIAVNRNIDSLANEIAIKRRQLRISMGIQQERFKDSPYPATFNHEQLNNPDADRGYYKSIDWCRRMTYERAYQASTSRGIDVSWQQQQQQEQTHHRELIRVYGQHPQPPHYSSETVGQQPQYPATTNMNWNDMLDWSISLEQQEQRHGGPRPVPQHGQQTRHHQTSTNLNRGALALQQHQQQQHRFGKRAVEGNEDYQHQQQQRSQQRPRLQLQHEQVPQQRPQHPAAPQPRLRQPAVQSQSRQHYPAVSVVADLGSSDFSGSEDYFENQLRPELRQQVPLQLSYNPFTMARRQQTSVPSNYNSSSTASHQSQSLPASSGLDFLGFPPHENRSSGPGDP